MKKALALLLALALVMGMTGCGESENTTEAAPEGSESQTTGTAAESTPAETQDTSRKVKDTLNIALAYDITSLDPQVGKEMRACIVSQQIFDTLVQWDEEGGVGSKVVPALAESWEYLDDNTLQLKLRQDVKFHNGEQMTADDVVYSIERTMHSEFTGYHATAIDHVDKIDDYTVNIVTKYPYGPLLAGLCVTAFSVVCKSVASADEEGFAENPVGTGPYKFVSYTSGDNIQLEAFDECWRGTPVTKHINMMIIPENSQRTVLLETGEADIAYEILPNDVKRVEENEDLQMIMIDSMTLYAMRLNCQSTGPVGNKLVRQAIEYCLNKEELVDVVLYGNGKAAYSDVGSNSLGYVPVSEERKQDFDKAKELLTQAGYPDGFEMSLVLSTDNVLVQYANIIQSELAKVGIKVNIETMESSSVNAIMKDTTKMEAILNLANNLVGDVRYYLYNFYNSQSSNNSTHFASEHMDELLDKGRQTTNIDDAKEVYAEINDIFLDERPDIPLYFSKIMVGANKNVFGFTPRAQGIHVLGTGVGCYED